MFRLYEIEDSTEEEISTRLLAHLHMTLDTKFPHTKAQVSAAFQETAFSIVEDTISDGQSGEDLEKTPGIPETRDSTPITKGSQKIGSGEFGKAGNYNEELGEDTQFSLDEPTQVTESDMEIKEKGVLGPFLNMLLIALLLLVIAAVAFFFYKRGL